MTTPLSKPILVAFDRTAGADAALEEATRLAKALDAPIELVFVVSDEPTAQQQLEEVERATADRMRAARDAGVRSIDRRLEFGDPATRLLVLAGTGRYRFVAVGTHGRTGFSRLTIGSVAEDVVRRSPCPVLSVRRAERPPIDLPRTARGRILVATDFSPAAQQAVLQAVELARATGGTITLLHVFEPPFTPDPVMIAPWMFDDTAARARLEKERRELERKGLTRVTAIWESGQALERILHAIAELAPDLVVLGTHGRTGFRRLAMGSVAERVVRRASCPVVTVHAPAQEPAIGLRRDFRADFGATAVRLIAALQVEGFGVLTDIDMAKTLQDKLDVPFRRYRILGACNPSLAYRSLGARLEAGTLLPCNVALFDNDDGGVSVVAVDPLQTPAASDPALREIAVEVRTRLAAALDRLGSA